MSGRKDYTENESMILFSEVGGICPLCSEPLVYVKKNIYKKFEIAHIYPLNPTDQEKIELSEVKKLSDDPNDLRNVISLCPSCHTKFDKPRTKEEYEKLVKIKYDLLGVTSNRQNWHEFQLEGKIEELIKRLAEYEYDLDSTEDEITYDPKRLDDKLNATITSLLKRKIANNVNEFYPTVSRIFKNQDFITPLTTEIVSTQIKLFFLKKKEQDSLDQKKIFVDTVQWINHKTGNHSYEASEILASYFIQNCELF